MILHTVVNQTIRSAQEVTMYIMIHIMYNVLIPGKLQWLTPLWYLDKQIYTVQCLPDKKYLDTKFSSIRTQISAV